MVLVDIRQSENAVVSVRLLIGERTMAIGGDESRNSRGNGRGGGVCCGNQSCGCDCDFQAAPTTTDVYM